MCSGEPVFSFDGLVRVDRGADRDVLPLPALSRKLLPEHLRRIDLDKDLVFKVRSRIEVKEGVVPPRVAVDALMLASPVGIDRPLEGHFLRDHPVEHALALDLDNLSLRPLRHAAPPEVWVMASWFAQNQTLVRLGVS